MLPFAHMGFGALLVSPWRQHLHCLWFCIGALTPDFIDKALYYGLPKLNQDAAAVFTCTRTVGHSFVFLLLIALISKIPRTFKWFSLFLGIATHQLIDIASDFLGTSNIFMLHDSATAKAFFFPLLGFSFGDMPWDSLTEHLSESVTNPYYVAGEVIGFLILLWFYKIKKDPCSHLG